MTIAEMAALARKRAEDRAGAGWSLLGEELQEALVARETLAVISANQDNEGWERAARLAHTVLVAKLRFSWEAPDAESMQRSPPEVADPRELFRVAGQKRAKLLKKSAARIDGTQTDT